jgi:hypothetical protein
MYEAGGSRHPKFQGNMSAVFAFLDIEKTFDKTWNLAYYINCQNYE